MNLVKQLIVLAILGATQFPILRRFVCKAHWWILVSAFGGALAGAGSSTIAYILHPGLLPAPFSTALAYGLGWLSYGIGCCVINPGRAKHFIGYAQGRFRCKRTIKLSQGKRKKIVSKVCISFRAMRTWLEASFASTS